MLISILGRIFILFRMDRGWQNSTLGWGNVSTLQPIYGDWRSVVMDDGGNITTSYYSGTAFYYNGNLCKKIRVCFSVSTKRNTAVHISIPTSVAPTLKPSSGVVLSGMYSNRTTALYFVNSTGSMENSIYIYQNLQDVPLQVRIFLHTNTGYYLPFQLFGRFG